MAPKRKRTKKESPAPAPKPDSDVVMKDKPDEKAQAAHGDGGGGDVKDPRQLPPEVVARIKAKAEQIAGEIADECCNGAGLAALKGERPDSPDDENVKDKMAEALESYEPITQLSRDEIVRFLHIIREHAVFLDALEEATNRPATFGDEILFDSGGKLRGALYSMLEKCK